VKHKHNKTDSGHMQWWFIVKGDEDAMEESEGEWDHVLLQTSWKLEACYRLIPHSPSSLKPFNPNQTNVLF